MTHPPPASLPKAESEHHRFVAPSGVRAWPVTMASPVVESILENKHDGTNLHTDMRVRRAQKIWRLRDPSHADSYLSRDLACLYATRAASES
jgi:hypothetical protein